MDTGDTALLIAIGSVALSDEPGQLALYWLSGARLQVRLRPAVLREMGGLIRRVGSWVDYEDAVAHSD